MRYKKRGQIEVTFHWVYILIAGAVILLFFAGIVVKQKAASEERLSGDIVRIMESILVGAGAAEKTKNFIKTEGLADYIFEFKCEGGYSGFGIQGGAFAELPMDPVFAPKEIKTSKMILWSLPYKLPYKAADLLMVTSFNTKYFVIGGEGTSFRRELEKSVEGLSFDFVEAGEYDLITPGKNYQVRVVYLGPVDVGDWGNVPGGLNEMKANGLSAVDISGNEMVYYKKEKGNPKWVKDGEEVSLISIAKEKDAAKYAAIFAGDGESYKCNMMKVFRRMKYVNKVYDGKLGEMEEYYKEEAGHCLDLLGKIRPVLQKLDSETIACVAGKRYDECDAVKLMGKAEELRELNSESLDGFDLRHRDCITLY